MIDAQTGPILMAADKLDLGVHDALARQIGQNLMAEQVGVDPLGDAGLAGVFLGDFSNPAGGELLSPVRFE